MASAGARPPRRRRKKPAGWLDAFHLLVYCTRTMSDQERVKTLEKKVSKLEDKVESISTFERWMKIMAVVGAVIAFTFGVLQCRDTREKEFGQCFGEKQYKLYSQACRAAANIALADDLEDVKTDRQKFWSLYWGELSVLENRDVLKAMKAYGENLTLLEDEFWGPVAYNDLRNLSYDLARA